MVKNYDTELNYILKDAYLREKSESAMSKGRQYTVFEL